MAFNNYFQAEQLIVDNVKDMFTDGRIYTGIDVNDLDNDDFTQSDTPEEQVGLLIKQAGFKVDPLHGKRSFKQQRLKFFWQLAVVCPSDLYDTLGGAKHIEVMAKLMGLKLSPDFTEINWIDDERDFNEPEFMKDLAYIPMMFEIQAILTGAK